MGWLGPSLGLDPFKTLNSAAGTTPGLLILASRLKNQQQPAVTRTRDCRRTPFGRFLCRQATPLAMTKTLRLLLATATVATVALGGAAGAFACGNSSGYSYAGVGAPENGYGISALISPLDTLNAFDVFNGHVAGWVGVGGPGEGPNGSDEWLQVGYAGFPGITGSDIYYEVALPGRYPVYHQVAAGVDFGTETKMTVLEMHGRADWWRVWVNHKPVSAPIHLPGSHGRWMPIATAESWDGGNGGACNTFLYRFRRVSIAHAPGGGWHQLTGGYAIHSAVTRIQRARGSARFFAAEGRAAFAALGSTS
jgi:hypothetical protein